LHDELARMEQEHLSFLDRTTLEVFVGRAAQSKPPAS
jgi:hypothetical protein